MVGKGVGYWSGRSCERPQVGYRFPFQGPRSGTRLPHKNRIVIGYRTYSRFDAITADRIDSTTVNTQGIHRRTIPTNVMVRIKLHSIMLRIKLQASRP